MMDRVLRALVRELDPRWGLLVIALFVVGLAALAACVE